MRRLHLRRAWAALAAAPILLMAQGAHGQTLPLLDQTALRSPLMAGCNGKPDSAPLTVDTLAGEAGREHQSERRRSFIPTFEAAVADIVAAGGRAASLILDVSGSADSIENSLAHAGQCFGRLDILVNNSGVTVSKPVLDQTQADWDSVINTNLRGAFFMSQSVARHMRAAGHGGCIVNVASILGLRQAGMVAPYAASKAALIQLTKSMALELARYSIRVNAIAPGYIASDLNADFFETDAGQALVRRIPQRHLGEPENLDGALLLLCSDASSYMTGSVITVDGGHVVSTL